MEQENIRLGEARGFQGIFTTNANRLTQLISRSLDYQVLSTIQVSWWRSLVGAGLGSGVGVRVDVGVTSKEGANEGA